MKILFQIEGRGIGGNETLLKRVFTQMLRKGMSPILLSPPGPTTNFLRSYASKSVFFRSERALEQYLIKEQISLVVLVHGKILQTARIAKALGIPVLWMYGHPKNLSGWKSEETSLLSVLIEEVIAQSKFLKSTLPKSLKTTTIQNGVSLKEFYPVNANERKLIRRKLKIDSRTFLIGYPARDTEYKSHAYLNSIAPSLKNTKFLYLGKDIKVPHFQMRKYLGACDLMVFPASEEGYGCAIAESIAVGVPVLMNRNGGHLEFNKIGKEFYFKNLNKKDVVGKINKIKDNKEIRKKMSKRAQAFSKYLDDRKTMELYLKKFKEWGGR